MKYILSSFYDYQLAGTKQNTKEIYTKNCYTGMFDSETCQGNKCRGGIYPATHCLKISAIFGKNT